MVRQYQKGQHVCDWNAGRRREQSVKRFEIIMSENFPKSVIDSNPPQIPNKIKENSKPRHFCFPSFITSGVWNPDNLSFFC